MVGASAAGLGTAEALRRKGYAGRLTVLGAEHRLPYDRPPLSKQVLSGAWEPERAGLRSRDALDALDAEFVLGDAAVSLDPEARAVRTAAGRTLRAEAVVLATGLRPRRLPGQDDVDGVHVLRTLDDAVALRGALERARRVVVVGNGVLGAEVAATAAASGARTSLVGLQPAPLSEQLGERVGGLVARLHARNGVRQYHGTGVEELVHEQARATGVRLPSGEVLPADVVVVAVGCTPATEWLATSGLRLDDGIVCDARCRAADGVYAVGDAARWYHEGLGAHVRLENRTNATTQAGAVAANLLGGDVAYAPVPYFWTDQFDVKIQVFGTPRPGAEVSFVEGDEEGGRFVAVYGGERTRAVYGGERTRAVHGGERPHAVLGWNMAKQARLHSRSLSTAGAAA